MTMYNSCLSVESTARLQKLLATPIWIHSPTALACGMPRIEVVPRALISALAVRLRAAGIVVEDVRLEGSAAAAFVCPDLNSDFNDIDVVFHLDPAADGTQLHAVRDLVLASVGDFVPRALAPAAQTYMHKMFLRSSPTPDSGDSWALFTLATCDGGPAIDIKCVQRCARSFQFSHDSLCVGLTGLLDETAAVPYPASMWHAHVACDKSQVTGLIDTALPATTIDTFTILPTDSLVDVTDLAPMARPDASQSLTAPAGSYYGTVGEAAAHLRGRVVAVRDEMEMAGVHGGGLLKYAALRARGHTVAPWLSADKLERVMCARFHVDFPTRQATRYGTPAPLQRVIDYLATHMRSRDASLAFLRTLRTIVVRAWPDDTAEMLALLGALLPPRRNPLAPRQPSHENLARRRSFVKA